MLIPTEYIQTQAHKINNNNQQQTIIAKNKDSELYQTIQNNQFPINQLKISTLISSKCKNKLIKNCTEIENNQSTLQTFGFKRSTKTNQTLLETQKTHIEETTFTEFILVDGNQHFVNRIIKDQELTRLLLQNPNGLDMGQDGLKLYEIIDSSIKYEIDIL